jgi:AcrR family transcriptional regulator
VTEPGVTESDAVEPGVTESGAVEPGVTGLGVTGLGVAGLGAAEAGLRERKLAWQRARLVEAGIRLFASRGFDATTVDEIAASAGVSRRTLFRYFGTKGDIVMEWARGTTTTLTTALRGRPIGESPLASLHAAFVVLCDTLANSPADIRAVTIMIESTGSLRPYSLLKHAQWEDALAEVLLERRPDCEPLRSTLLARVAVAAFRTALDEWLRTDGERDNLTGPIQHLDRAFVVLRGCFGVDHVGDQVDD